MGVSIPLPGSKNGTLIRLGGWLLFRVSGPTEWKLLISTTRLFALIRLIFDAAFCFLNGDCNSGSWSTPLGPTLSFFSFPLLPSANLKNSAVRLCSTVYLTKISFIMFLFRCKRRSESTLRWRSCSFLSFVMRLIKALTSRSWRRLSLSSSL